MNKKIIGYKLIKPEYEKVAIEALKLPNKEAYNPFIIAGMISYYLPKIKELGIMDWFEPVYEEDKKLRIFTLDCKDGRFELEVSTDGILYRPDSAYLDIEDLNTHIRQSGYGREIGSGWNYALRKNKEAKGSYYVEYTHISLGCKKSVPIQQLKEVVDYYNSIK
jgi:hypothetical protein